MDRKAIKAIGYDHDDGYRIYLEEDCKLIRLRDFIFKEEKKMLSFQGSLIIARKQNP